MFLLPLSGPGALSFLSFLGFFISLVNAGIVNRTIDDTFGDSQTGQLVSYAPPTSGVWKDENCVGCAINPDVSQAFKRTYTAATYNPGLGSMSITMQFTGIAVYVFFILANNAGDGITTLTLANFTLDGNRPQLFQHAPDLTTTALQYNQLVFSQTNLVNAEHTLVISTSGVNTNVYVNFDYAIYTHDDNGPLVPLPSGGASSSSSSPSSSSSSSISSSAARSSSITSASSSPSTKSTAGSSSLSSTAINPNGPTSTSVLGQDTTVSKSKSSPVGAIAGGVVGGLAVLLVLAFFLLWRMRKGRAGPDNTESLKNGYVPAMMTDRRFPPSPDTVDPFILQQYPAPSNGSRNDFQYGGNGSGNGQRHSPAASRSLSSPIQESMYSSGYAYDGIAESSDGQRRPEGSTTSSSVLAYYGRGPLHSVTSRDHLTSPDTEITTPSQAPTLSSRPGRNSDNVEDIRRARQNELNQRLRTVQDEMAFLASDMTGEKTRSPSIRRRRTVTRPAPGGGTTMVEVEEEEEMSMAEMREQLQVLRDQVSYLREQQRSDWAQGLSDDPPPGYTPASPPPPPPHRHPLPPVPGQ